jgi:hypothetical protein
MRRAHRRLRRRRHRSPRVQFLWSPQVDERCTALESSFAHSGDVWRVGRQANRRGTGRAWMKDFCAKRSNPSHRSDAEALRTAIWRHRMTSERVQRNPRRFDARHGGRLNFQGQPCGRSVENNLCSEHDFTMRRRDRFSISEVLPRGAPTRRSRGGGMQAGHALQTNNLGQICVFNARIPEAESVKVSDPTAAMNHT